MRLLRIAAGCVLLWGGIAAAPAQVYPSRPITMVVPFAAGGPVDTVARILSEPMRATLGQNIEQRQYQRGRDTTEDQWRREQAARSQQNADRSFGLPPATASIAAVSSIAL